MLKAFIILAALFVAALPASAKSPPLQPTAKWIVNFDEAQCFASRNYGSKDRPLYLALREPAHRSVIQLSLIRKGSSEPPEQVSATLQFDNGPEIKTTMLSYYSDSAHLRVFQINVPIDRFGAATNAASLRVNGKWLDERLELSSVPALMRTMDKCVADLRLYWNVVDVPADSPVGDKSPPNPRLKEDAKSKANLAAYFSSDDYPWAAVMQSQSGTVEYSLLIDKTGKVADCSVIQTSGIASLDAQSCAILTKRARFTPAIGLDGKPARDAIIGRVRWVMR